MESKPIFFGGMAALVLLAAAIAYLAWQQHQLRAGIRQIESSIPGQIAQASKETNGSVSTQMQELVTEQQSRLNNLENRITDVQSQLRDAADSSGHQIEQVHNELSSFQTWTTEQLAELSAAAHPAEPQLSELPHTELDKIAFTLKGIQDSSQSYSDKCLAQISLTNGTSWFIKRVTLQKSIPGNTNDEELSFEFDDLIAPQARGKASAYSSSRFFDPNTAKWRMVERVKWRIASASGYESAGRQAQNLPENLVP